MYTHVNQHSKLAAPLIANDVYDIVVKVCSISCNLFDFVLFKQIFYILNCLYSVRMPSGLTVKSSMTETSITIFLGLKLSRGLIS